MEHARDEIAAALAESGPADQEAALRVLALAFRWACDAVRRTDGSAAGSRALATLYALDDALEEGRALADAVPVLLAAARPGEQVGAGTDALVRRLAEAAEQVAAERAALEERAAAEEELRGRLAQHAALRREVDELRRLERLVAALDGLRAQQRVIAERLAALRGQDAGVDEALRTSSDALVRLSEDQLAALTPQTRQTLERAAAAQRALAAEESDLEAGAAELAEAEDRLERVRTEWGAQLASLQRYAQADRELAQTLAELSPVGGGPQQRTALQQVATTAADIEQRLGEADRVLARVLAERDAADNGGRFMVRRTDR